MPPPSPSFVSESAQLSSSAQVTHGFGVPLPNSVEGVTLVQGKCDAPVSTLEVRSMFLFYTIPGSAYPHSLPDRCKARLSNGDVVILRVRATE